MKNTFPPNCKQQKVEIVLIGTGFHGINLVFEFQSKFKELNVVLFEKSILGPFLLQVLLKVKGKPALSVSDKCSKFKVENITFTFNSFPIESIDKERKEINHMGGKQKYDTLIIEQAKPWKILSNSGQCLSTHLYGAYRLENEIDKEKIVLIEGQDLFAIAIAIQLLHCGIVPKIICKDARLAHKELPEEEGWLIGKYLKNLGVESIYKDHLLFSTVISKNDLLEIKTAKNKTMHVHSIFVASEDSYPPEGVDRHVGQSFPNNIHIDFFSFYSAYTFNHDSEVLNGKIANDLSEIAGPSLCSQCYLNELEWKKYGEISPNCGQDTQNFYWEHPRGEVSFRMQYDKSDLLIKGLSCLGLPFKVGFIEAILAGNWNAHEFIERMTEGLANANQTTEIYPLIKKSFEVVFKDEIKKTRDSFIKRIIKKIFS